jgi:hypothetical protein
MNITLEFNWILAIVFLAIYVLIAWKKAYFKKVNNLYLAAIVILALFYAFLSESFLSYIFTMLSCVGIITLFNMYVLEYVNIKLLDNK